MIKYFLKEINLFIFPESNSIFDAEEMLYLSYPFIPFHLFWFLVFFFSRVSILLIYAISPLDFFGSFSGVNFLREQIYYYSFQTISDSSAIQFALRFFIEKMVL